MLCRTNRNILVSSLPIIGYEVIVLISLTFRGTVGMSILLFGNHSGKVINPAITVAAFYTKLLHKDLFIPCISFQLIGGILAGLTLLYLFVSIGTTDLGSTKLARVINPAYGITTEAVDTLVLALSAFVASSKLKRAGSSSTASWRDAVVHSDNFHGASAGAGFNPAEVWDRPLHQDILIIYTSILSGRFLERL